MKAKKSLGQNFLSDSRYVQQILNLVPKEQSGKLIEIGPGTGVLTPWLYQINSNFEGYEIDDRAIQILNRDFPTIPVFQKDFLKTDLESIAGDEKLTVVGNIPYYITSPILFHLFDQQQLMQTAVIMMQKEVAERIVAEPRTKAYGILSVQAQIFASVTKAFDVPRSAFMPRPNVDSSVLVFEFDKDVSGLDIQLFKSVVRTAFNQRRKMMRNSLKPLLGDHELPEKLGMRRPESLTPQEFVELTEFFGELE